MCIYFLWVRGLLNLVIKDLVGFLNMDLCLIGVSGFLVLKLLVIKCFFIMFMDNRMKRLMMWLMMDDVSYVWCN